MFKRFVCISNCEAQHYQARIVKIFAELYSVISSESADVTEAETACVKGQFLEKKLFQDLKNGSIRFFKYSFLKYRQILSEQVWWCRKGQHFCSHLASYNFIEISFALILLSYEDFLAEKCIKLKQLQSIVFISETILNNFVLNDQLSQQRHNSLETNRKGF